MQERFGVIVSREDAEEHLVVFVGVDDKKVEVVSIVGAFPTTGDTVYAFPNKDLAEQFCNYVENNTPIFVIPLDREFPAEFRKNIIANLAPVLRAKGYDMLGDPGMPGVCASAGRTRLN
jgi:hypothetical protein